MFPLDYVKGTAPQRENEIALSNLNASEMEKQLGDTVTLVIDGQAREMVVSGVYQDITNGGRTAKAMLPHNPQTAIWYTISLDLAPGVSIEEKVAEYAQLFDSARVTDTADFCLANSGQHRAAVKDGDHGHGGCGAGFVRPDHIPVHDDAH
ncbi:MAG: hypothetical protein R3E31_13125 [Chloroflexota bacterium]